LDYDLIVVGAGPVGSTVADEVARDGYKVLLVEEHETVGSPAHCTGKLSFSAARELGLQPPGVLAELRGAFFYSPSGNELVAEKKETQAYILDRRVFDSHFASKAVESGACLETNTRATSIRIGLSEVSVELSKGGRSEERTCRVVVGSDGVTSTVARLTGLYSKAPSELRMGAQRELNRARPRAPGFVEVFLGSQTAPGFFAWLSPSGKERARVGLCVKPGISGGAPMERLEHFIVSNPIIAPRLAESEVVEESIHAIPTGGALRRTIGDGVLVVGDAAGQVKSTTGGGLYYGILCARMAGEALSRALEEPGGTVPGKRLERYELGWRRRIGEEISFSVRARAFLDSLTDDEVDFIFQVIKEDKSLAGLIESLADIDYQSRIGKGLLSRLALALMRRPNILSKAGRYLLAH
jgi:digeranylgeranylglycerophospholipid reductase